MVLGENLRAHEMGISGRDKKTRLKIDFEAKKLMLDPQNHF